MPARLLVLRRSEINNAIHCNVSKIVLLWLHVASICVTLRLRRNLRISIWDWFSDLNWNFSLFLLSERQCPDNVFRSVKLLFWMLWTHFVNKASTSVQYGDNISYCESLLGCSARFNIKKYPVTICNAGEFQVRLENSKAFETYLPDMMQLLRLRSSVEMRVQHGTWNCRWVWRISRYPRQAKVLKQRNKDG